MIFIKFYILTRLGGHKPTKARIMKTGQIEQVVSSVWHKMRPTRCLLAARSVCNSDNVYNGRIEFELHDDTTVLDSNFMILIYTGK